MDAGVQAQLFGNGQTPAGCWSAVRHALSALVPGRWMRKPRHWRLSSGCCADCELAIDGSSSRGIAGRSWPTPLAAGVSEGQISTTGWTAPSRISPLRDGRLTGAWCRAT
eukprot:12177057-Alexandrium_andersonii.AAC.1